MNKTIIAMALLGLFLFTACSVATTEPTTTGKPAVAQTAPEVAQATSEIVDTSTVEIGEML